jgi:hypothetical protein
MELWQIMNLAFGTGLIGLLSKYLMGLENRQKVLKAQIYQQLETTSLDFFKWRIEHKDIANAMNDPECSFNQPNDKEFWVLEEYACIQLNLFEMAIRFRKEKYFEENIFYSWLAWMFELSIEHNFPVVWQNVRRHYIGELREIMDAGVSTAKMYHNRELASLNTARDDFYRKCAQIKDLKNAEKWLKQCAPNECSI